MALSFYCCATGHIWHRLFYPIQTGLLWHHHLYDATTPTSTAYISFANDKALTEVRHPLLFTLAPDGRKR